MALVEEFSVAPCLAIFDDHVVVCPVEADEHLVVARNEHTFIIGGVVVDVVPRVVAVVQIQVTAVVVAFDTVVF